MIKNTLPGIDCTVKECVHHTENDKCSADCIKVNGCTSSCDTSCDTECKTFKPRCC